MSLPLELLSPPLDGAPVRSPDVIASLPLLTAATSLLQDCAATGGLGVISGPPGSGKSIALRRLATRYASTGLPGSSFYYCCQSNAGATRGVKDILAEMGVGGALIAQGHGTPMQLLLKIALREFVRKGIRCILLDETDRWDEAAVSGVIAMHDDARDNGHSFSLIMATMEPSPAWLANAESARSRTLRVIHAERALIGEALALLALWSEDFAKFNALVDSADQPAIALARRIHEEFGGDLRRLNFFVRLYICHWSGRAVSKETVNSTIKRLNEE